MPVTVSFVSQKGGVGKSTIARALAVALLKGGVRVLLADLDLQQRTSVEWSKLRRSQGLEPPVDARPFKTADDALIAGELAEVLIVDGPARASAGTLELARQSDLVVQPSGCGLDDLRPAVLLFHELLSASISRDKLVVALTRSAGEPEEGAARRYIQKAKYAVLAASLPEDARYRDAMNRGASLIESPDRRLVSRAQAAIDEIVSKVRASASARAKGMPRERVRR